jgi:hypothetical protein
MRCDALGITTARIAFDFLPNAFISTTSFAGSNGEIHFWWGHVSVVMVRSWPVKSLTKTELETLRLDSSAAWRLWTDTVGYVALCGDANLRNTSTTV